MKRFIRESAAIVEVELIKLVRDPTEDRLARERGRYGMAGGVRAGARAGARHPDGAAELPGVHHAGDPCAERAVQRDLSYGIGIIWERDLGVVHKLLASPARLISLVFGKALAAGFRGILQATVIYLIALLMHTSLRLDPVSILAVLASVMLGSGIFATFSLVIACIVKTRERFMGIGQLLTMPMFFASNAIYPLEIMPEWLRVIAQINPLTYLIDALRGLMIMGGESIHGYTVDFAVMFATFGALLFIAVRLYPRWRNEHSGRTVRLDVPPWYKQH